MTPSLPGHRLRGAKAIPQPEPRKDTLAALEAENRSLRAQLAERDARIASLEEQLTAPPAQ